MQFHLTLALGALFLTSALAIPNPPKPTKPAPRPQPTPGPVQTNSCGNGAAPYCCNTDNFGLYTTCTLLTGGNLCSATTVCCNANNSVQVCLGNAQIL